MIDIEDTNPLDAFICRDIDNDNCDDCSLTGADNSGGDTNNDGEGDCSNIEENLIIYPNPTNSILNIRTNSLIKSITISDTVGRVIINANLDAANNSHQLNINNLKQGSYFVVVDTLKGVFAKQIIKN